MKSIFEFVKGLFDMPKTRSEETSSGVAKKAGSILRKLSQVQSKGCCDVIVAGTQAAQFLCTVDDLQAVCASALTQAKDKHR